MIMMKNIKGLVKSIAGDGCSLSLKRYTEPDFPSRNLRKWNN